MNIASKNSKRLSLFLETYFYQLKKKQQTKAPSCLMHEKEMFDEKYFLLKYVCVRGIKQKNYEKNVLRESERNECEIWKMYEF